MRAIATFEAFYAKLVGKEAKWGNTGGIGRGSVDELPNLLIVVLMIVGFVRSVSVFLWKEHGTCFFLHIWPVGDAMFTVGNR